VERVEREQVRPHLLVAGDQPIRGPILASVGRSRRRGAG
jgi:hypothetical protein